MRLRPPPGSSTTWMIASRAWEQGALGLALLVVARRLGVEEFAPVSALIVVNSLAVTISDFGVGFAVLRLRAGTTVASASLQRVRVANAAVLAAGVLLGAATGGRWGAVVAWGAAAWAASAESYIRKSAALRNGRAIEVVQSEVAGGAVLLAGVLAFASGSQAVTAVGVALVGLHLVESAVARTWRPAFSANGGRTEHARLWLSQVLAYLIANVDFVVVAPLLGSSAFAVYVLAFRIASVVPAQVTTVTTRVSLVEFAAADPDAVQRSYRRLTTRLFLGGSLGVLATVALLPLVPPVLGDRWQPVVGVAAVLCIGIPWRIVMGVAGSLLISAGRVTDLLRWELGRLAVTAGAYTAAASVSLRVFTVVAVVVSVGATLALHAVAARSSGFHTRRAAIPAGVASVVLAVAAAPLVQASL